MMDLGAPIATKGFSRDQNNNSPMAIIGNRTSIDRRLRSIRLKMYFSRMCLTGDLWPGTFFPDDLRHFLTDLHVFGLIFTGKPLWVAGRGRWGTGLGWPGIPQGYP